MLKAFADMGRPLAPLILELNSSSSLQTNTFEYLAHNLLEATAAISTANSPARTLDNSKLKLSGFPKARAETKLSGCP